MAGASWRPRAIGPPARHRHRPADGAAGGAVGRAVHHGARAGGGAGDGRGDAGAEGRRRRARGGAGAAAIPGCAARVGDVSECGMRSSECGIEGEGSILEIGHPARRWTVPLRIPHSAFRTVLAAALMACGSADGPHVTVTIPSGATLDAAVDSLASSGVIGHPGPFRLYAKLRGLGGSLKSGVYLLRHDESWADVVAAVGGGGGGGRRLIVGGGVRLPRGGGGAQHEARLPPASFLAPPP